MRPVIESRGERVSVECPDCDSWVVLAPAIATTEIALDAMDRTFPGASSTLASISVFAGGCICGAQLGLTMTRARKSLDTQARA
jgi:hypothetical protein